MCRGEKPGVMHISVDEGGAHTSVVSRELWRRDAGAMEEGRMGF